MANGSLLRHLVITTLSLWSFPVAAGISTNRFHEEADARMVHQPILSRQLSLTSARRYRVFQDGKLRRAGDDEEVSTQQDHATEFDGLGDMSESEAKVLGQWFVEHHDETDATRLGEEPKENIPVDDGAKPESIMVAEGEVGKADNDVQIDEQITLYDDPDCIEPEAPRIFKRRKLHRRNLGGKSGGKASKSAYAYQIFQTHNRPYREVSSTSTVSPVTTSTEFPISTTTYRTMDESDDGYYYQVTDDNYWGKSQKSAKSWYYPAKSAKSKAGKWSTPGDVPTETPETPIATGTPTGTPSVRCTKSPTLTPSYISVSTDAPSETKTLSPTQGISSAPTVSSSAPTVSDIKVTASPVAVGTSPPSSSPVALPTPITASPITTAPTQTPVLATSPPTSLSPIISLSPVAGGTSPSSLSPVATVTATPTSPSPGVGSLSPTSLSPVGTLVPAPTPATVPPTTLVPAAPTTVVPSTFPPVTGTSPPTSATTTTPPGATLSPSTSAPVTGTSPPTAATTTTPPGVTLSPSTSAPVTGTSPPTSATTTTPPGVTLSPSTSAPSIVGSTPTTATPTTPAGVTLSPSTSAPSTIGGTIAPATLLPSTLSPSSLGASEVPSTIPSSLVLGTLPPTVLGGSSAPSLLSNAPTGNGLDVPTTIAPTSVPVDATYFRGFEQGNFPFVIESTDPVWTTENSINSTLVWELTNEKANTGVFSIRSPVLENEAATPGSANATLTMPDLGPGTLFFSINAGVQMPIDAVAWFVDGELRESVEAMTEFEQKSVTVTPGPHVFQVVYAYNPGSFPAANLPPDDITPNRTGAVYLDDVYFIPLA